MATERRILQAAAEVFTERGFAAATIAEMVERSELSRGAFYIHFTNKRNVFFALVTRAIADLYGEEPLKPGGSWPERIRASIRAYVRAFAKHRGIMKCLFETSTSDPEIGALHNRHRAAYADRLTRQIEAEVRAGNFRPVDARATSYCLGGLISGAAYRWICADFEAWPDDPMTEDRLVDTIADIWCRTLFVDDEGARPRAAKGAAGKRAPGAARSPAQAKAAPASARRRGRIQ